LFWWWTIKEPRSAGYQLLSRFIPDFICLILSNPKAVKCSLLLISSATIFKSSKSLDFIPNIGYFLKNGIILFARSDNRLTTKSPASSFKRE